MMDKLDYTDPICPFDIDAYKNAPGRNTATGAIPIHDIIQELDRLYAKGQYEKAGNLLKGWKEKAKEIGDKSGQLSIENELLGFHRQYGNVQDEIEAIASCKQLLHEVDMGGGLTAGTILINMGTASCALGKASDALLYYSDAFRSYGEKLDPYDERFAVLYNNMAAAYLLEKEYEQAETSYRKAYALLSKNGPHPDAAVTLLNLASMLLELDGENVEVPKLTKKALEILDHPSLIHNAYYAHTCRKCYDPLLYLGFFRDAKRLQKEADNCI